MSDPHKQSVDESPWTRYRPSPEAPWNLRRVAHLHRRAGFAANWGELQRDLADGPEASVARLLGGRSRTQSVAEGFEKTAALLSDTAREPERLKAWWVYRMLYSPDPLGERLTLMWHNHFATSALKVRDLSAMRRQNELFRGLARAPYGQLLAAAVRDPAMLVWLDAPANRKEHPNENESAWQARLAELGICGERHVRIVTEGALLGGLMVRGLSPDLVVLSDGAPQFDVLQHASCWIHAERPLARMVPYNEEHRALIEKIRAQIWELYQDLKAYRQQPDVAQKPMLEARFDALCDQKTGYPSVNGVLKEMRDHKADLLRVLERPEVPLHNNACESDIREYVKKRKISGSTRSAAGRRCRDTFASLKKTCRKLGVNFWNYLQDRLRGLGDIPRLAELIHQRTRAIQAAPVQAVPA